MTLDQPRCFDFYVDRTRRGDPTIGLVITSASGSVTVPFSARTANNVGELLLAHAAALTSPRGRAAQ